MCNHEKFQEKLIDMALGQLPENEIDAIITHIENCSDCDTLYKNLIKVLDTAEQAGAVMIDNNTCEDAKAKLFDTIDIEGDAPVEHIDFTLWSNIMKSPIIKIAAAAVILIAAALTFTFINNPDKDPEPAPLVKTDTPLNGTDQGNTPDIEYANAQTDLLKQQLTDVDLMFASADKAGLRKLLETGEYEAKVKAANYLASLGDVESIDILEQTAEQYDETQAQPFVDAVAVLADLPTPAVTNTIDSEVASLAAAATADDIVVNNILDVLPADTLFCLKFNKLDYGLMNTDQFLKGLVPIPMPATMGLRMQLSQILADPTLSQVDTIGDFSVFGIVKPGSESKGPDDIALAYIAPFKDYAKFITDNPNCSVADGNGVSTIKQANAKSYMVKLGSYGLISDKNEYNTLIDIANILTDPGKNLASVLPAASKTNADEKPLWAYANVGKCNAVLGEEILKGIDELQESMAKAQEAAAQQKGHTPEVMPPADALNMHKAIYEIISNEVDMVAVSLDPTPQAMNLEVDVKAVEGTPMAKMFSSNPDKKPNPLLYLLQDDTLGNASINMNSPFFEEMSLTSYDLISLISDDISEETMAKTQELVQKLVSSTGAGIYNMRITDSNGLTAKMDAYKSENKAGISAGLSMKPENPLGFQIEFVAEMRDADTYETVNEEIMMLWGSGGFGDVYKKSFGIDMDYTIEKDVETYRGVSIDSAFFKLAPTDPNSQYGQMITAIYGGGFSYRTAVTDGLFLCTFGTDSELKINDLIDRVKDGDKNRISEGIKNAIAMLGDADEYEFFGTYNFYEHMSMAMNFMGLNGISVPQQESNTSLVYGGTCNKGTMTFKLIAPKDHIKDVIKIAEIVGQAANEVHQKAAQKAAVQN